MRTEGVQDPRLFDSIALNDSMEMSSIVDQRESKRCGKYARKRDKFGCPGLAK